MHTDGGDTCRAYRARRALLTSGKPSVSGVIPHFSKLNLFYSLFYFQVKSFTPFKQSIYLHLCLPIASPPWTTPLRSHPRSLRVPRPARYV